MRAVVITKHGDLSVLKVQERPDPPPPAAGQVRIAVRAAGVNFADHLARVGLYPDAPKPPSVVGYEVAGTIEAVGDGVDASRVGERVLAGTRFGGYAEIVNVKATDTVALPDTHELRAGRRRAGELRHRVGRAARVRIAARRRTRADPRGGGRRRHRGHPARQTHRSRDPRHRVARQAPALSEMGVDRTIDYRRDGWWKDLPPYDIVLDAIGGASLRRSYDLLRPGGRLVAYGISALQQGEKRSLRTVLPQLLPMLRGFNLTKQLSESKAVIGLNMLTLWDDRGTLEPWIGPCRRH